MKKWMSLVVVLAVIFTGSFVDAGSYGGRGGGGHGGGGYSRGGHGGGGWGHYGGRGWGRGCYGYGYGGYYGAAPFWTDFGLNAAGLVLGAAAIYNQPDTVYINNTPQIVYQPDPQPQVIVQQAPAPQVIYQQQPAPAPQVVVLPTSQQFVYPEKQDVQYVQPTRQQQVPVQQQQPEQSKSEKTGERETLKELKIYLPVGNGSFVMVPLIQTLTGFIGPQGEFYPDHPTIEQLNERYMKK